MPKFPFVVIPKTLDANGLHAQSSCVFWTVMAAVMPLPNAVQQAVRTWFRKSIAERVVVQYERSLELLQAILLHLAWYDCFEAHTTNDAMLLQN